VKIACLGRMPLRLLRPDYCEDAVSFAPGLCQFPFVIAHPSRED